MPTYEYRCKDCGEHLEVVQSFRDDALTTCPACSGELRKVFGSIGIVFKGSGFYKTDSRSSAGATKSAESASGAAGGEAAASVPAGDSKPADAKSGASKAAEAKSTESSGSTPGASTGSSPAASSGASSSSSSGSSSAVAAAS